MLSRTINPHVYIACGGTGGHLFPGLAVGEQCVRCGAQVTLLVSEKEVDQQAVRGVSTMRVRTLPTVGLSGRNLPGFARGFAQAFRQCRQWFRAEPPGAVLAMGGFTSAPPVLAGRLAGAQTFLHESNTIPGRANRWLSWFVARAFIGFPEAASRLHTREVTVSGTPVRREFQVRPASECRAALKLAPDRPVLLVMGGSQGAGGINALFLEALPLLQSRRPDLQFIHLTGTADFDQARERHSESRTSAVVLPFCSSMDLALGASTLAVCRAGASTLAELSAVRLPALLLPFPFATDDHQRQNARAFERTGAARWIDQTSTTAAALAEAIVALLADDSALKRMREALAGWDRPRAAEEIVEVIFRGLSGAAAVRPTKATAAAGSVTTRPSHSIIAS